MAEPDSSSSSLNLRLFGPAVLTVNGQPIEPVLSKKGLWLLALLVLRAGRSVDRDWLAGTLWPESTESQALDNLRHCLTDLRKTLGQEAARLGSPTHQTLCINLSGWDVDVVAFDAAITKGDSVSLAQAVSLYRGPLLEGCTEEWVLPEREAREQAYLQALEALAQSEIERQEFKAAIGRLRLVVTIDPLRESAQRSLMQALATDGEYAAAVQVYRELRLLLHRELHTEPDPQTLALFKQIRAEAHGRAKARPVVPSASPASASLRRLTHPLTALVGRRQEVEQIIASLRASRLMTLTGPGGVGKTRLAIAVAEEVADGYRDGACFVELAALSDPALVVQAVSSVLELREEPGRSLLATLWDYLTRRELLLVLDNCEHLIDSCARLVEELLSGCAQLHVLATSRQSLGLTGEVGWPVPGLSLPASSVARTATETEKEWLSLLWEYEAIQLFIERAQQALPSFQMNGQNAEAVAQICSRLEGMPLAIELAAARVKVMAVEQIALRLEEGFSLLIGGSRTALPRQQTLRATLDWSYNLLNEPEQVLLGRLCVFAGGWSLEAAEQVCAGEGIEAWQVLDLLASLVDKSLVVYTQAEGQARYHLLETVRQYAWERLREAGQEAVVQKRHLDFFLSLAEQTEPKLHGPEQTRWLDRLEAEHDNLRTALAWSRAASQEETGLRLAGALYWFWHLHSHLNEGRAWLEEMLACAAPLGRTKARAKALQGAGQLAHYQMDYRTVRLRLEESAAIWQELGDQRGYAHALIYLSIGIEWDLHDNATACSTAAESITIMRMLGDKWGLGMALWVLGVHSPWETEPQTVRLLLEESATLLREVGDAWALAAPVYYLGGLAWSQGEYAAARSLVLEAMDLAQQTGDKMRVSTFSECLGAWEREMGHYGQACSYYCQSLTLLRQIGNYRLTAHPLLKLAELAAAQGQAVRAVGLLGAIEMLQEGNKVPLRDDIRIDYEEQVSALRMSVGEKIYTAAWAKGKAMTLEQAIEYALKPEIPLPPASS